MKLSISKRLIATALFTCTLSAVIVGYALIRLQSDKNSLVSLTKQSYPAALALKDTRIAVLTLAQGLRDMALHEELGREAYASRLTQQREQVQTALAGLKTIVSGQDAGLRDYCQAVESWLLIGDQIVQDLARGRDAQALLALQTTCPAALTQVAESAQALGTAITRAVDQAAEDSVAATTRSMAVCCASLAATTVLSLWFAEATRRRVVRPVARLEQAAGELAEGRLGTEITYQANDELGALAGHLRVALAALRAYIADIDQAMGQMSQGNFDIEPNQEFNGDFSSIEQSITAFIGTMSQALRQMESVSREVAAGAEQIAAGSQSLAQGATEQASAVEEISATMQGIVSEVRENAAGAQEADRMITQMNGQLDEANRQMQAVSRAMDGIDGKSSEIGKIVKTIDEIAFQTNLLALNAAVEAARAGQAGKGFAVVADEVRNLALKSATAAKNTTELIAGSVTAVQEGSALTAQAAASLAQVVTGARAVSKAVDGIAQASQRQAVAAGQVEEGVSQISMVVQSNSGASEQIAAAAQQLSGQASSLQELLGRFHPKADQ